MSNEFYKKLVDLYAGRELPSELENDIEEAAANDAFLKRDMMSLRHTVDALRSEPPPEFTEESYQRILIRMYTNGIDPQPKARIPSHFQYQLPIQG